MLNYGSAPQVMQPQFSYNGNGNTLLGNMPFDYQGRINGLQQQAPCQYFKCRPVSSRDEAMAYQIDLDGSLWVFTDIGNKQIYTKQINPDGTASFKTYVYTDKTQEPNDFVTREEFDRVIQSLTAISKPQLLEIQ